ncbi:MAG: hypothetical protein AAF911_10095 [Planctomycetota bacterium]
MPEFTNIPPDDAPFLDEGDENQLVLVKNGHRYVFDCGPGQEHDLLQRLQHLVADPTNDLNWFDAAVLSHQMGQRMSNQLTRIYRDRRSA